MRRYETIFIVDPDLSEDARRQRFEKAKDQIGQMKGVFIQQDDWGNKRLAYEIRKKTRGHYMRFDYCGTGEIVDELERNCRIDDKFLKFMTIILEENSDPEKIKAEIAEKAQAEETVKAEKAVQTEETAQTEEAAEESDDTGDAVKTEETESDKEDN